MSTAFAVLAATNVMAENGKEIAPDDTAHVYDLDEIVVVTQTKEYQTLRQQPVSSNVFTNDELTRLSIRDLKQLSDYVPAFVMPDYGPRFTSSIYVSGHVSTAHLWVCMLMTFHW